MILERINEALSSEKSFFSDFKIAASLGLSFLINIIHWLFLLSKIKIGSDKILLHYNVVYGPDFVEKSYYILVIPLLAFLSLILNIILSRFFYRREKMAAYFLNIASVAVQVVFLVATITLILANE